MAGRRVVLDGRVVADVAEAENAIARLNADAASLADTEAIARLLLRAESVASSRIEGFEVGGRRLLRAEAALELGVASDVTAEDVLGNIAAMRWAVGELSAARSLTVDGVLEVHRILLDGTRASRHGGSLRTEQNWIGGSSYNPCRAEFVPPPPEHVEDLLEDLCGFCNDDALPAVVQAAVAHAQFETIHPFADGNGRTGRALIHVILRRRGLAPSVLPPVSLVLATWSRDYVDALTATRYTGSPDGASAREGLNRWIELFATACKRSVDDALRFEQDVRAIQGRWRTALGRVRAGSAVDLLVQRLPGSPIVTVQTAAALLGRSFQQTNAATARLVEAGVLRAITVGRRNRAFEAPDILNAFNNLERSLASPAGNTRASPPSRRIPRRPTS